jgi:hypothetical protein
VLLALIVLSHQTQAASPDYSFVEIGYIDVATDDFDTGDFDFGHLFGDLSDFERSGDGRFFSGSFGAKRWHVFGEYRRADLDDGTGFGQKAWWVGGGWHGLLGKRADLVAEAAYVDAKIGTSLGSIADDGVRLSAGLRFLPIKLLELNGFYNYADIEMPTYDDSYEINVLLKLWWFRLGAGYERFDNASEARIFARYVIR